MKQIKGGCDVPGCYLCAHSIKEWRPAIAAHQKSFAVKKGQRVFNEGDAVTGIYFVLSGKVKVHKRWDADKEIIVRFAQTGDVLGQLGLGSEPIYPVSTTALEPTVVSYIDLEFFEASLAVNPKLTYALMKMFANELQGSEKRMRNLVHMPVRERIALALIDLQKQFGINEAGAINIDLSRQDLSSFAAVSYETLFKVTNDFMQLGLIASNGRWVTILNEEKLREIALDTTPG